MKKLLAIALTAQIINSTFLYTFDSPNLFYLANIFLHLGLGILLLLALIGLLKGQFGRIEIELRLACFLLLLAGLIGLLLMYTGTTSPYRLLLTAHIALACLGSAAAIIHLVIRRHPWRLFFLAPLCPPVLLLLSSWFAPDSNQKIVNPPTAALSLEEEGPGPASPFFPSPANTNLNGVIPSKFFMEAESCARSGCHPDIYHQWSTSAHHFASFNNQWYRKSVEYMQEVVGTQPSKWCGGCHDHALLFSGMMDRPIKEQLDLPESQAGLTCTSCHAIVSVAGTTGNGGFTIEYPYLHDLATSGNRVIQALHDWLVRLDPEPHKKTFMKPFMRSQPAEFCSTCHKAHLDSPINSYRWIRGFNEYDGWQSGAASGQGAQAFYDLDQSKNCVDCHMPLLQSEDAGNVAGVVHDHRFPGANTALPHVNGHQEQLRLVSEFLQNDQIGVDLFAIQITPQAGGSKLSVEDAGSGLFGHGASYTDVGELVGPLDRLQPVVNRGDWVQVDVVVQTKGVGHFFPGGTIDAFDVWVELKAVDDLGQIVFWSGHVPTLPSGKRGPVDPKAHFYRSVFLDGHDNPINKRNVWAARSSVYSRSIPPGAADVVHYGFQIPEDAGERIFLTAKVNHRKFSWWNTHFAYAGVRDPKAGDPAVTADYDDGEWTFTGDTANVSGKLKEIPDLPITTMASSHVELQVAVRASSPLQQTALYLPEDERRWNYYGIGLLTQRDFQAAERVFNRITEINPEFVEGWINLGRSRLLLGRPDEARTSLLEASKLGADTGKVNFFLGITAKDQGDYSLALDYLQKAEAVYPSDRRILFQLGRTLLVLHRYEEAIGILQRAADIDPEDSQIHYQLSLCYEAVGDQAKAQRELRLHQRFRPRIAVPFGRARPEDDNERHPVHLHDSFPLGKLALGPDPA